MNKQISILFFLLIISSSAFAQENNSMAKNGSVYSQFGIGLPAGSGSSSAYGAGVWGVSDVEPLVPTLANPAQWGYTYYGMASGGIQANKFRGKDNLGTAHHSRIDVNSFQLQLPLSKGKLGLSLSFSPYTRSSFQTIKSGQKVVGSATGQKMLNFKTKDFGTGGINRYELGLGWKINSHVSVGYAASLYHASIKNDYTTTFADTSYTTVNNTILTSGAGFGNRLGTYLSFPLAGGSNQLNLGITVNFPVNLKSKKSEQKPYVTGNPNNKNSNGEKKLSSGSIHTPLGITAGVTYKPSRRVAVLAEGRFQQWSDYHNTLRSTPSNVSFTNRYKIGAGLKYYPFVSGSDKFLSQFKYRIGANYDTGNLKINGKKINTLKLTAGFGLFSPTRIRGFNSSIDIDFYYGIRGTTSHNLVKENIYGIKLSLNLAELFFFRPKLQ